MSCPVTVNISHGLGKEEAHRRIAAGFGRVRDEMSSGFAGLVAVQERWEGDRLQFEGTALGQKLEGRIEIMERSVQLQIDLPPILGAFANRIIGRVQSASRKLLETSIPPT